MQVWNKTFKNSQHCACQPGFCDSKALFFHSFCCSLLGCQNLWLWEGWITWTRWCKGCMPTQGNPQRQALSGDRLPYLSKHHPEKLFFGPASTVKNPITSLTAFKDSTWLPGEKANSDRRVCFRSLTWHFAPFMPGNKRLNKGWGSWIWQWSFSQKPWACLSVEVKNVIRARSCKPHWFRAVALIVLTVYEGMDYSFAKMPQVLQKEHSLWEAIFHQPPRHNLPPWSPAADLHPFYHLFLEYFSMLKIDPLGYA